MLKKLLSITIALFLIIGLAGCETQISDVHSSEVSSSEVPPQNQQANIVKEEIPAASTEKTYKVIKVVDGDTIKINFNNKEENIRLIGVDTPESVHPDSSKNTPEGKVASEFTKKHLEGKEITIEFDTQERDRYGRLLGYIWINGEMFNKVLLREGMASVATFPPNVKYVDDFTKLEKEAKANKKGLWGATVQQPAKQPAQQPIQQPAQQPIQQPAQQPIQQPIQQPATQGKIKGNADSKIYHVPGGSHYNKLKNNVVYFDTEAEAQAAGYRKSKN